MALVGIVERNISHLVVGNSSMIPDSSRKYCVNGVKLLKLFFILSVVACSISHVISFISNGRNVAALCICFSMHSIKNVIRYWHISGLISKK